MGHASESPRAVDILSVAEIQQIHNFCLEAESVTGGIPPFLMELFNDLFTFLGINPHITINPKYTQRVHRTLIWYHILRLSTLVTVSVGLLCLQLRVVAVLNSTSLLDSKKPLSGAAAVLRMIYWVFTPVYFMADRVGCLAHVHLLSVQANITNSVNKSTSVPPILSVYWQLVGDALLSSLHVFISVTPAILYQFPFGATLFPVFLAGIIVMVHTITALRESTSLLPAHGFWIRAAITQRLLMILLYLVYRLDRIIVIQLFIPRTFLLITLSALVYLLPFTIHCFARQIVVEQNGVSSHRAHMAFTESLTVLRQGNLSRQHLKPILHRFMNGTYSAVIAMLSITVPLYLVIYRDEGSSRQSVQYTTRLIALGAHLYGLLIGSLQFRALLCFLRGSLEWDKRIEPYMIFYPLVMLPFYKMHIMKPHTCYFCLIALLMSAHYSMVSSLYTELRRVFKFHSVYSFIKN